jgi:hypothetical protein
MIEQERLEINVTSYHDKSLFATVVHLADPVSVKNLRNFIPDLSLSVAQLERELTPQCVCAFVLHATSHPHWKPTGRCTALIFRDRQAIVRWIVENQQASQEDREAKMDMDELLDIEFYSVADAQKLFPFFQSLQQGRPEQWPPRSTVTIIGCESSTAENPSYYEREFFSCTVLAPRPGLEQSGREQMQQTSGEVRVTVTKP